LVGVWAELSFEHVQNVPKALLHPKQKLNCSVYHPCFVKWGQPTKQILQDKQKKKNIFKGTFLFIANEEEGFLKIPLSFSPEKLMF
jgi:hypothetical protein